MSQARFYVVINELRDCSENVIPEGTVLQVSYSDVLSVYVSRFNDSNKSCKRLLREVNESCVPASSLKWIDANGNEVKHNTSKKFYANHKPFLDE